MTTTRFHLIRHATTDAVGHTLSGRTPIPLNAQGQAEAARLATSFAGEAVDAVLSSPQLRALQTAQVLGRDVRQEAALDEVDFGPWTAQSFAALQSRADWVFWNRYRSLAPAPGCETMLQVQARAAALLAQLHSRNPGASFVLVSHADVLKSVFAFVLGLPIDLMQRLEISPAARSLLEMSDTGIRVDYINLRPA